MFRIAHITDVHIPPLPPMQASERSIKRILGYLSWHRKRKTIHDADILKALDKDVAAQNPDHILVSGDLTSLALDEEYKRAGEWLHGLGKPEDVSVVPGNHDAYSRDVDKAVGQYWSGFACGDEDGNCTFPFIRKRGDVAIIGLSSAVPTKPLMANGRISQEQLKPLPGILDELKAEGLCRVIMIHHPPQKECASFRRGLSNGKVFREIIAKHGAELIVHGHEHDIIRGSIDGPDGRVPVRGAGSASASGKGHKPAAHYHVFDIDKTDEKWRIEITHRQVDPVRRIFSTIALESLHLPRHSSM